MDGWACAWVAHLEFGDQADYVPVQYGQEPPDVTGREVYLLDFSYKRPVMERLSNACYSLVVLDHHETAEAELRGFGDKYKDKVDVRFDMASSGGMLTWEYFYPYKSAPWLVNYTQDRDLWTFHLPFSREINAALASYPKDFRGWDLMCANKTPPLSPLVHEGAAILRYQAQLVESAIKNATETEIEGYKVLAVNATCLISEIGEALAKDRPFGATFFINSYGKKVWSLRSRGENCVNVSEVAKRRGGGGHKQAAGFTE